ncbi:uncharacterized protein RSE6_03277 [Rhynchosporium secalis]|uniref:Uncharacterized protein n=1 Tax=Rhynchosporium secalis TaxID=38038 RepID=A0A1E1M2F0_RHYSE|nr:uncharacterized protein RSE6_03277 [Rhynchosporium secalis]
MRFRLLEIGWWLLNYGGSLAASETTSFWWAVIKIGIEELSSITSDDDVRNISLSGGDSFAGSCSEDKASNVEAVTQPERASDLAATLHRATRKGTVEE